MIDLERVEKAILFLASTDHEVAELKTNVKRTEYVRKRKEAHAFLSATGNIPEREAQATLDCDVIKAYDACTDAMAAYEELAARRERAALEIDVWRTVEASRRLG